MIIKQIKGENFTPLCIYQFQKIDKKEAEIIDSNMLGDSALSLSREFNISADQRPNLKKTVYHASLSIHPEEKLTNNQFRKIGKEFLQKMGFDNNQYLMVRHYDSKHPHRVRDDPASGGVDVTGNLFEPASSVFPSSRQTHMDAA